LNLVFHTITAVSTSSIFLRRMSKSGLLKKEMLFAFSTNLVLHAIEDLVPHRYPFTLTVDLIMSFIISILLLLIQKKKGSRCIVIFSLIGALVPDIIDKGLLGIFFHSRRYIFFWHNPYIINFSYNFFKFGGKINIQDAIIIFQSMVILLSIVILIANLKFVLNRE